MQEVHVGARIKTAYFPYRKKKVRYSSTFSIPGLVQEANKDIGPWNSKQTKMLHIVTIKWKPGAPVEEIMKNLRTLKEKVPGHVLSVTVGETFMTERAKGFTHSMVTVARLVHHWAVRGL